MKKIVVFTLLLLAVLQLQLLTTGCANIIPPTGGPKDSLPPVVTNAIPRDSSKNFKDNRITISFNEYIDVQDIQKNLLVSPVPKTMPAVERKLSSILIRIKDTLEPNTTYSLNFGNAIRDINEANILRNYTYIFTTGDYFDSLTLRGKVILARDGTVDTTLTVMLHTDMTDSSIVKNKPRYIAKINKEGNFTFKNLPPGTFAIYAISDQSGTYRFSGRDQLFAFADQPVTSGDTSLITLYAFPDNEGGGSSSAPPKRGQAASKDKRLVFQTNLEGKQQDLLSNLEMNFQVPLKTLDTTKIGFYTDSVFTPVTDYQLIQDTSNSKLTLKYPWKENTLYHLIVDKEFAKDTLGYQLLKTDTISFTTKKYEDYGTVKLKFQNLDMSKNPVLLFIKSNNIVDSSILTGPEFFRQLFKPGEYNLRILYDDNKNGTWDPGIFFGEKKQPELVKPLAQSVNVKANWENEKEIDINALPAPPRQGGAPNAPQKGMRPGQNNKPINKE